MDFANLNKDNVLAFALKYYDNPQSNSMPEFMEDLRIPKYIKRLFNKAEESGELRERLILNHLTTFYNVFQNECATRLLFFYIDPNHWSMLKTFLIFLQRCPKKINGIATDTIPLDQKIIDALRKI